MSAEVFERPDPSEYDAYYGTYIQKVPDGEILETLECEIQTSIELLSTVPESRAGFRYAPDKWSIREMVAHLIDSERVFSFRGFTFARSDSGPLPGMDQDIYTQHSGAEQRALSDLLNEWSSVREATLRLFQSLDPSTALLTGVASDCEFTVRTFPWIIAGHEIHHRGVLEERYL